MDVLTDYGYVLAFLVIGFGFAIANTLIPYLIARPSRGRFTTQTYESGVDPIGSAWVQFDIGYYLFALIFIAFDVEAIFLFPVLIAYFKVPTWIALAELTLFMALLGFAILYAWRRGILSWK